MQKIFLMLSIVMLILAFTQAVVSAQASEYQQIHEIDWSISGEIAVGYYPQNRVEVFNEQSEMIAVFEDTVPLTDVAWSPDGNKLAYVNFESYVAIWDKASDEISVIEIPDQYTTSLAWSHDSEKLVTTTRNGSGPAARNRIRVWDVASRELISTIEVQYYYHYLNTVSWNPVNETQIATGSLTSTVIIWDMETREPLQSYGFNYPPDRNPEEYPEPFVEIVAWSPDGRLIAAGTNDGQITIWDTETEQATNYYFLDGIIEDLEWEAQGRLAVSNARGIQILNPLDETFTPIYELSPAPFFIYSLAWSPEGDRIAFGTDTLNFIAVPNS